MFNLNSADFILNNNASLGYRQHNTAYAVGAIAYHSALPAGWYLECTTAGISSKGNLTITSPAIGNTVNDGAVTWRIGMSLSLNGGKVSTGNIITSADNSWIRIMCGDSVTDSPAIFFNGNDGTGSANKGLITLSAMNKTANTPATLSIHPSNGLTYQNWEGYPADLGGSAIVVKSLGANGYIKYASGLTLQWGIEVPEPGITFTLPISYSTNTYRAFTQIQNGQADFTVTNCSVISNSQLRINTQTVVTGGRAVNWFTIGY